jgi:hypothetical protein
VSGFFSAERLAEPIPRPSRGVYGRITQQSGSALGMGTLISGDIDLIQIIVPHKNNLTQLKIVHFSVDRKENKW